MNMRTKKIVCASFISLLVVLLPHEQKNMKGNMKERAICFIKTILDANIMIITELSLYLHHELFLFIK